MPTHTAFENNTNVQAFVDDIAIQVAVEKIENYPEADTQEEANCMALSEKYHDLNSDFERVGLTCEPDKTEVMHFRDKPPKKAYSASHPRGPDLYLSTKGKQMVVKPKEEMRYLGFWFDPRLTWRVHVTKYCNKACSTIGAISMLGNSVRGFHMRDKRRLYISNVLPIMTYGALVWWTPEWKGMKWALDVTTNYAC